VLDARGKETKMKITLKQILPAGFIIELDGQTYTSTGRQIYQRENGEAVAMNGWQSHCADCGESIDCMSVATRPLALRRRCAEHAKPGVRVKAKKPRA
jgi:hypothetical protein